MPYDPRLVSEGGNRGIDEVFQRAAPEGKYRVVGVDTFDGGDWHQGDFDTRAEANKVAAENSGSMTKMYVYDDHGHCLSDFGTY